MVKRALIFVTSLVFAACLSEGFQEDAQKDDHRSSSRIVVTFGEYRACNYWNDFSSSSSGSSTPPCASMAKCYGRRLVLDVSNCYSKQSMDSLLEDLIRSSVGATIISVEEDAEVVAGSIAVEEGSSSKNISVLMDEYGDLGKEEDNETIAELNEFDPRTGSSMEGGGVQINNRSIHELMDGGGEARGEEDNETIAGLNEFDPIQETLDNAATPAEDGVKVVAASGFVKGSSSSSENSIYELMVTAGALDNADNEALAAWNIFNSVQAASSILPKNETITGSMQLPNLLLLDGQQQSPQAVSNPDAMQPWNLQLLGIPKMWEDGKTGTGTVMAVLDSGIAASALPMFGSSQQAGYDFISDDEFSKDGDGRDPNPLDPGDQDSLLCPASSSWHGTYVSSVAASRRFNEAFSGIAFNTTLLSVRVLGRYLPIISDFIQIFIVNV